MKKILQKYSDSIIATLALIINRGLDAIILLVITPFLIKIFGVDNYGELSYYLAIIFFIQTFIIFGFENYIIYNTSNNKKNHSIILSSVMTIKITIFFILALIYIIFV
ncbi:oligosaccharide flippase family protein [Proteus mirabilis]